MKYAKGYRFLLRLAIVGSIISLGICVVMGFYSIAISMGGHGQAAVIESEKDGNEAEQFFFLTIGLIVVAIFLVYRIKKLQVKYSEQNE